MSENDEVVGNTAAPVTEVDSGLGVNKVLEEEKKHVNNTHFVLNILEVTKLAQAQNGLRHGDYTRYREYCARRLRRLRKGLRWTHGRKAYKPKTLTAKHVTDVRFLFIPLMNAERAWSYAMDLKQQQGEEVTRAKHHVVARLAKAVVWAAHLLELSSQTASSRTHLEAEAYHAFMLGNLLLEKEKWALSLKAFQHSKRVYAELAKVSQPGQAVLCEDQVAHIQPSIRYCTYVIKRAGGDADDEQMMLDVAHDMQLLDGPELLKSRLEDILSESQHKESEKMSSVIWRGSKVPIKNEKTRMLLIEAEDKTQALLADNDAEYNARMDAYNAVFSLYDEAMQLVRQDLQANEGGALKGNTKKFAVDSLKSITDFVTHKKLICTVQRLLLIADDLKAGLGAGKQSGRKAVRPGELVHLYDKLTGTDEQIVDLLAVDAQDNKRVSETSAANRKEYEAFRAFYVAATYSAASQFREACALLRQTVTLLAKEALKLHAACPMVNEAAVARLTQLQADTVAAASIAHASSLVVGKGETKEGQGHLVMEEHLKVFDSSMQIARMPPKYEPMPGKPVLFDLALNAVAFPDLTGRFPKPQQPKKKHHQQQQQQQQAAKASDGTPAAAAASGGGWLSWITNR